jgi:hypothetical protein
MTKSELKEALKDHLRISVTAERGHDPTYGDTGSIDIEVELTWVEDDGSTERIDTHSQYDVSVG